MSTVYIILLLIGSLTLTKNVRVVVASIKKGNKEKIKVDIFFLLLSISVIIILIVFERSTR